MITLTKGQEVEYIYCTPMDYLTSIPLWLYFKFVHRVTEEVVEYWGDSIGASTTNRYAKYGINTAVYFADSTEGMWTYTIQETTEEELVPPASNTILESGYLYLYPAATFEPTKYEGQDNSFIAYDGQ
jgi:hypothetical protein